MRIPLLNKCKSLSLSTWHVKQAKWKAAISISHAKAFPNTPWSLDEWLFHPLIDSFTQYLSNMLFVGHWSGYWEPGCNSEGKVPGLLEASAPQSSPFSSVQSLNRVRLFATPWIVARQASLPITNSRSSLRLRSIESVMPSSHLILCRPLLLLPPIPPSIRVFLMSQLLATFKHIIQHYHL